jgi:NTE family protein
VVHRTGRLADAVRASMSVPGLLPPVRDRSGRVLVDGGVLDNLPIATMAAMGGGPIVAADVTAADDDPAAATYGRRWARAPAQVRRLITGSDAVLPSLGETIVRCVTLASSDTGAASRQHADLVISPEVSGIGLLDWQRLPEMRTAGIAAVAEALAGAGEIVDRIRAMSA